MLAVGEVEVGGPAAGGELAGGFEGPEDCFFGVFSLAYLGGVLVMPRGRVRLEGGGWQPTNQASTLYFLRREGMRALRLAVQLSCMAACSRSEGRV